MKCNQCGTINEANSAFCIMCGSKLNNNPQNTVDNNINVNQQMPVENNIPQQVVDNNMNVNNTQSDLSNLYGINSIQPAPEPTQAVMNNTIPTPEVTQQAYIPTNHDVTQNNNSQNNIDFSQMNNNYNGNLIKNGKTSMILGIIALIMSVPFTILAVPLAIVGLVYAGKSKGHAAAGTTLNIIALTISALVFAFIVFVGSMIAPLLNGSLELDVVGRYNCGQEGDKVIFDFDRDNTFQIRGVSSTDNVLIKGSYEVSNIKYDEETENVIVNVVLNATSTLVNDDLSEEPATVYYQIQIKDDEATIININTNTQQYCEVE